MAVLTTRTAMREEWNWDWFSDFQIFQPFFLVSPCSLRPLNPQPPPAPPSLLSCFKTIYWSITRRRYYALFVKRNPLTRSAIHRKFVLVLPVCFCAIDLHETATVSWSKQCRCLCKTSLRRYPKFNLKYYFCVFRASLSSFTMCDCWWFNILCPVNTSSDHCNSPKDVG